MRGIGQNTKRHLVNTELPMQRIGKVIPHPGFTYHVHVLKMAVLGRKVYVTHLAIKRYTYEIELSFTTTASIRFTGCIISVISVSVVNTHHPTYLNAVFTIVWRGNCVLICGHFCS